MRWNTPASAFRHIIPRRLRPSDIPYAFALGTFLTCLLIASGSARAEPLVRLVHGLPWSGVSSLIGYRGRLWFANSVKFVNHNSADLYSFDPRTGNVRYEKHLFSQDAGDPVIAQGLLYWPFEDSRFSPGHGEFMVTNGRDWGWHVIPKGRAFHTHAMASAGGKLYAATSAWSARIAVSENAGTSWDLVYEYPTPDRRVSRITSLAVLGSTVFAGLTTWYDDTSPKLLRLGAEGARPVPGWPSGSEVSSTVAFRGYVYAVNTGPDGASLWRTDGSRVERLQGPNGVINDFATDGKHLWAVTARKNSGVLWYSQDGTNWSSAHRFDTVRPLSVALFGGTPYVGVLSDRGGELWGPANAIAVPYDPRIRALPHTPRLSKAQRQTALASLDRALSDKAQYRRLRFAVRPLALDRSQETSDALIRRLSGPFPEGSARMFGRRQIRTELMAPWYLLWAIAHNGRGRVPLHYFDNPWTSKPNRAEKYIHPPLAAAWAVGRLNQRDNATLAALMKRLDRTGDPNWLIGDMVGALTDLTGKRFGYDLSAWRRWWRDRSHLDPG